MPQLTVVLTAGRRAGVVPGECAVTATFTNHGDRAVLLNVAQASHPALVLEIEDEEGRRAPMRPPAAPRPEDGGPGDSIEPGESAAVTYAGFLDRSHPAGRHRIRYAGRHAQLGGTADDPLLSDWLDLVLVPGGDHDGVAPLSQPPSGRRTGLLGRVRRLGHGLVCRVRRLLGRERCERVLTRSVDEDRSEVLAGAPPGFEAWNGTYAWRARFRVRVDQGRCRVIATIRVRLAGEIDDARRDAWEAAIEDAWSGSFKLCCSCCCCRRGYTLAVNVVFVGSGEDQVVNAGEGTTGMGSWGRGDTDAVRHVVGHMLGAVDEYFTVDGAPRGPARQAGAGIMNNPGEGPAARHYALIERAAAAALGAHCETRPAPRRC